VVARNILERREGDGITMDCLVHSGKPMVICPCIAWSKMLDRGIPRPARQTSALLSRTRCVQLLFDRPGFPAGDPVAETARECLMAPLLVSDAAQRFQSGAGAFDIMHTYGAPRVRCHAPLRTGQRVTVADVILPVKSDPARGGARGRAADGDRHGAVVERSGAAAGGCVVSGDWWSSTRTRIC